MENRTPTLLLLDSFPLPLTYAIYTIMRFVYTPDTYNNLELLFYVHGIKKKRSRILKLVYYYYFYDYVQDIRIQT